MGQKWAQRIYLGRETTPGTAVAATTVWRGIGGMLTDTREVVMVDEQIGIAMPTTRNYIPKLSGSLSMAETPATFEQLPHLLEAGIKTVAPTTDGSGKIYTYPVGMTSANTIKIYTIETGDNQQAEEMEYSFVESFTLSAERGSAVMMSAEWIGRQVTNSTFTSALSIPAVSDIMAGDGLFYIDAVSGSMGGTAISGLLLSWSLDVTTGWRGKWTVDSGQRYFNFAYFDKDSFSAELSMTFEHDGSAVTQKGHFRSGTPRLFRIRIPGPALNQPGTTYQTKLIQIDAVGVYNSWEAVDSDEGNSIVNVTARIGYDPTAAKGLQIVVVNELSTLP